MPLEINSGSGQVRHIPSTAPSSALLDSFSSLGDVKGILARFQATHGVVILAFYDTRHAARALRHIAGHKFSALDNVHLEAEFVSPGRVEKVRVCSSLLFVRPC